MKNYLVRAMHYLLKVIVIVALAFALMYLLGWLDVEKGQFWRTVAMTPRGWIVGALLIVLSAVYPVLSFGTVQLQGDFGKEREVLDRALGDMGYRAAKVDDAHAEYRAKSCWKRLSNQFDDNITVSGDGKNIYIAGQKKDIGRVEVRFMQYRKEYGQSVES